MTQKERFPIGAIVVTLAEMPGVTHNGITYGGLPKTKYGVVTGHTSDGGAIMNFGTSIHTFEDTLGYVSIIDTELDIDFSHKLNMLAKELP